MRAVADRIAARSTTAGTPVKSCRMTRAGLKGTSAVEGTSAPHLASRETSSLVTVKPSTWRNTASNRTRIENGNAEIEPTPPRSSVSSR